MKREIKFRAYDKFNKEMFYSDRKLRDYEFFRDFEFRVDAGNGVELMQYTGLKDKNGKEIYEGDILTVKSKSAYKYITAIELGWTDDNEYGWYWLNNQGTKNIVRDVDMISERYEVIGNIYENPNLFKTD
jgi:uncharacterized phage protein (TIGR01671 family)